MNIDSLPDADAIQLTRQLMSRFRPTQGKVTDGEYLAKARTYALNCDQILAEMSTNLPKRPDRSA
jgi:hypothetical protein